MTSPQTQPQITQQALESNSNQQLKQNSLSTQQKRSSPQQIEKKLYGNRPKTSEIVFFQIMDLVDQYDHLLKDMNDLYTEGMLTIANVKFINPYSSLSTKGFKPTPAITKLSLRNHNEFNIRETNQKSYQRIEKQSSFKIVTQIKDIKFTNSVINSINAQNHKPQKPQHRLLQANNQNQQQSQTQSQSAHSSQSTANHLYSYEEQQLMIEEEERVEECRKLMQNDKLSKEQFIFQMFNIQSQQEIVAQAMNKFNLLLQKLLQIADKKIETFKKFDSIQAMPSSKQKSNKSDIK